MYRSSNPLRTASQSRVFRLSLERQRTIRKKPGIAPPIGGVYLSCDLRERVSAEESHFLPALSLVANLGGHTMAESIRFEVRCTPSARFSVLCRPSTKYAEEARKCATKWRSSYRSGPQRHGLSGRMPRFIRLSLQAICGVTLARTSWFTISVSSSCRSDPDIISHRVADFLALSDSLLSADWVDERQITLKFDHARILADAKAKIFSHLQLASTCPS